MYCILFRVFNLFLTIDISNVPTSISFAVKASTLLRSTQYVKVFANVFCSCILVDPFMTCFHSLAFCGFTLRLHRKIQKKAKYLELKNYH